jgi:hypothetical protein
LLLITESNTRVIFGTRGYGRFQNGSQGADGDTNNSIYKSSDKDANKMEVVKNKKQCH